MTVESNTIDGRIVCAVKDALTIWETADTWRQILPLLSGPEPVTIDLSEVSQCDCSGIQVVCQIHQSAAKAKKKIAVRALSEPILAAMRQAGLDFKPLEKTSEGM